MTEKQAIAWVRKNCKFAQMDLTQAPPGWESNDEAMRRTLELQKLPKRQPKSIVPFQNVQQQPTKPPLIVKRYDTIRMMYEDKDGNLEAGDPIVDNEEEIEFTPDEYDLQQYSIDTEKTAALLAARYLYDKGAYEASSSQFHPGIWYSSEPDGQDGDMKETTFHIKNATPQQEQEIYNAWMANKSRTRATP